MKTIADFKRKMQIGAKVKTTLFWNDKTTGQPYVQNQWPEREVSIVQSNSFAFKTMKPGTNEPTNSWCDWPKKGEFTAVDEKTGVITFSFGKLVYEFL